MGTRHYEKSSPISGHRRYNAPMQTSRFRFHYAWLIAVAGVLVLLAALGFGRFALGMLLPSMGEALHFSYDEMGFVSTGNFIGYLLAVVLASRIVNRFGYRMTIVLGVIMVGASLMTVGFASGFWPVLLALFFTGIGSGLSNVPVMGLVSHWFRASLRGRAAGSMTIGNGIGIMATGLLVPWINLQYGADGWRYNWVIIGLITVLLAVICGRWLRNDPRELGLMPLGDTPAHHHHEHDSDSSSRRHGLIAFIGGVYFMFGFTYVIYATFIVTTLVRDYGFSESVAGQFWFWIGFISMASGPLFGYLSDRIGRGLTLAIVYGLLASSYGLVALHLGGMWLYLSIFLFGVCVWAIPSIMAAIVGDYVGTHYVAAAFGIVTLFFGMGQISGPAIAGIMAERSGSFESAYLMATAVAIIGLLLSLVLRRLR